jgi:pimeloyl-ACP methyl ester carboxylesterase
VGRKPQPPVISPAKKVRPGRCGAATLDLRPQKHQSCRISGQASQAYAGWGGSLPPEVVEQRLQQALRLSELSPEELVATLLPTMFSATTPPETVEASRASMLGFHPVGLRAMARASAENLRDVLPHVKVPTLLVYGDRDVRAPLTVAEDLHAAIPGSTLVVLPGAGHACNIEAPEEFNRVVRTFLRDQRS